MSISTLRDWIHETPLSQCFMGSDECDDWPLAIAIYNLANDIELSGRDRAALDRMMGQVKGPHD